MNYQAHYDSLIKRAKDRTVEGYCEKHHIIPKCMGGSNKPANIVILYPEEHYLAHLLLVKIHPDNIGLLWSAMAMTNATGNMQRNNNKRYGWLRRRFSDEISKRNKGRSFSEESRRKMSMSHIGKKRPGHTEETKIKMSLAATGRKKSVEHCAALSISKTGKSLGAHKEEHNEKIKQSNIETAKTRDFSYLQDEDYKKSQSNKMREIWAKRKAGLLEMPNYKGV